MSIALLSYFFYFAILRILKYPSKMIPWN